MGYGIVKELKRYYNCFGVRGVLAISAHRLIGRPREITVQPPNIRHPVHLRMGTSDIRVYRGNLLRGEYDFNLPSRPKTIVDVGANVGMASLFFTHKYPEAQIVAIEAEASNFAILSKNVKPYRNIFPVHAALWNRDGYISVSARNPAKGAFSKWGFVTHEGEGPQVRAITIPTLMAEMNISWIDLLKVNIEGAEREVFEDCNWMPSVGALAIALHDGFKHGCSDAVNSVSREFSKYERGEMTFYIRNVDLVRNRECV